MLAAWNDIPLRAISMLPELGRLSRLVIGASWDHGYGALRRDQWYGVRFCGVSMH